MEFHARPGAQVLKAGHDAVIIHGAESSNRIEGAPLNPDRLRPLDEVRAWTDTDEHGQARTGQSEAVRNNIGGRFNASGISAPANVMFGNLICMAV